MQSPLKLGAFVTIIGLCLALVALLVINKMSISMTSQVFNLEPTPLTAPPRASDATRGAHLVRSVLGCMDCHDQDLAGKTLVQDRIGSISSANLTQPKLTAEGYNRAVRYGLREDGRGLWLMPTQAYGALSDADLAAVIAYLQGLSPVARQLPANRLDMGGRWLVATGKLKLVQAGDPLPTQSPPEPGATAAYGGYLAQIARCTSCHGAALRGDGKMRDAEGSPDISPTGLTNWHEADFLRAMREGKRPDGSQLTAAMPWRTFATMTDLELRALWAFLQAPPLPQ